MLFEERVSPVQLRLVVQGDLDGAVMNAVVDPVRRDAEGGGHLRYGQGTRDASRVRLAALAEQCGDAGE
jgi:hypothetical protein